MKCISNSISYDGVNLIFKGDIIAKVPKEMQSKPISKGDMDTCKETVIEQVCKV